MRYTLFQEFDTFVTGWFRTGFRSVVVHRWVPNDALAYQTGPFATPRAGVSQDNPCGGIIRAAHCISAVFV